MSGAQSPQNIQLLLMTCISSVWIETLDSGTSRTPYSPEKEKGFLAQPYSCPWDSQVVLAVKNLPASAWNVRDLGLMPGSGRSPTGRHGNPFQYSCWENFMDRGAWRVTVHGVCKRVGCDWATEHIHRMAKSQTQLSFWARHLGVSFVKGEKKLLEKRKMHRM